MTHPKDPDRTRTLPDFIVIGTQRAATTWLYSMLFQHPDIWMPPIKEIHYFDHLGIRQLKPRLKKILNDLRNVDRKSFFSKSEETSGMPVVDIGWYVNYFLRRSDFSWYSSIFESGKDRITGEITPTYHSLDIPLIKKIYALNPRMKIIFIMRDPIDRTWSGVTRHFALEEKKADLERIDIRDLQKFIRLKKTVDHCKYLSTLDNWCSIFPKEQIQTIFFDDVEQNPEKVILEILEFLGANTNHAYSDRILSSKLNSTTQMYSKIPPNIEYEIAKMYLDELETLSVRFGGHTLTWLEHAKKTIRAFEDLNRSSSE